MSQPSVSNSQIGSFVETNTPNGVPVRADSILSIAGNTVTIVPAGTSYTIYVKGEQITINSTKSLVVPNIEGRHYIYFDDDSILYSTQTQSKDLMSDVAFICAIHWSVTGGYEIFALDERHGTVMDPDTRYYILSNPNGGTVYGGGLAPSNMVLDGDGSLETHAKIGITNGEIIHLDLQGIIENGSPQTLSSVLEAPILYRVGATGEWRRKIADQYPFVYVGQEGTTGTLLSYNEWTGTTWQWTEMANNNYMLIHIFASLDITYPLRILHGVNVYTNIADATAGAKVEVGTYTGLPFERGTPIATFIVQTSNTYSNTPKTIFVTDDDGNDFTDWRVTATPVGGSGGDSGTHGDLGEYTLATIPSASTFPNNYALVTDAVGGRTIVRSDGTDWKILAVEGATVS